jgi:hypothetical protein
MGDRQRREFHEALLDADSFEDLPGQVAGGHPERRGESAEPAAHFRRLVVCGLTAEKGARTGQLLHRRDVLRGGQPSSRCEAIQPGLTLGEPRLSPFSAFLAACSMELCEEAHISGSPIRLRAIASWWMYVPDRLRIANG